MKTLTIVLLVILVVLIIACIVLYFLGKRAEKKQAEQQEQLAAVAQTVSMLIIDKGKMRLKEAGFPSIVVEGTPKYLRRSKVPVVKAKVGPNDIDVRCPGIPVNSCQEGSKGYRKRYLYYRGQRIKRAIRDSSEEERLLRKIKEQIRTSHIKSIGSYRSNAFIFISMLQSATISPLTSNS